MVPLLFQWYCQKVLSLESRRLSVSGFRFSLLSRPVVLVFQSVRRMPQINLAALFCIASSRVPSTRSILEDWVNKMFVGSQFHFRAREHISPDNPRILFPLANMMDKCSFQTNLESTVIPRYLTLLVFGISVEWSLKVCDVGLHFRVKVTCWYLRVIHCSIGYGVKVVMLYILAVLSC